MSFGNKVFVVTGGGAGIGREVVLQLLEAGAKVGAIDISEQGLKETKSLAGKIQNNLSLHQVDITNKNLVEDLPREILKIHGAIDGVLNIAGIIQPFIPVAALNYEQIERVMNVNFYGTMYMLKAFLPHLLNNKTTSYISNVSSMGGFLPVPGQSAYGASKAAVKLLTEGLYAELKDTNVKVSIVFPGAIATEISKNSGVEINISEDNAAKFKPMPVQKAAQIMLSGIKKKKFRILIGKDARMMDIFYRISPKRAVHIIANKLKALLN